MTYPPQGQPYDPSQQPAQPDPYAPYPPAQPDNAAQSPYPPGAPVPPQEPLGGQYGPTSAPPAQDPYAQTSAPPNPYAQPAAPPDPYAQTSAPPAAYPAAPYPPAQPQYDPYAQTSAPPAPQVDAYGNPITQAWQAPMYTAPQPPKSKAPLFAAIGGGAALFVVALIVIIVLVSGGGPTGTVEDWLAAVKDKDITEANSLVCDTDDPYIDTDDLDSTDEQAEFDKMVADLSWEVVSEHEAGDQATVRMKLISSGPMSGEVDFELVKRGGDWFICGVDSVG
ncbi:hypothetical protein Afil01_48400 [Actinorhabdospora filicis]|uniref:DUF4878 domain-containing protein n=1 Tax=Actinorhabdospora filicis TaxID=1785913 RepID=A0A9W6WBG1_9ACTN|nr:hypothetical protein [Actinorhabdospora filicis]GLZ80033.1 hypothetical protein Afil01_48400 [Actinorhabdospora filicis]